MIRTDMGTKERILFPFRQKLLDLCMLIRTSGREQLMEDSGKRRYNRKILIKQAMRDPVQKRWFALEQKTYMSYAKVGGKAKHEVSGRPR